MKKSTVRALARSARPVCIASTSTNAGHVLSVCAARRRVTNESVSAIASRLVNVLETFDRDTVETFADARILTR